MENAVMELMEIKRALRTERFVRLEEQIRTSVHNRANLLNLATEEQAGKTNSKLIVTGAGDIATNLVITFKPDDAQVHIKSAVWDHTIRILIIGTASTGLQQRQGRSQSWSVLEDEAAVERMLDHAFKATWH
jgi:hypothetical protein